MDITVAEAKADAYPSLEKPLAMNAKINQSQSDPFNYDGKGAST